MSRERAPIVATGPGSAAPGPAPAAMPLGGKRLSPGKIGVVALVAAVLATLAWAALAPLDEGVPAAGSVIVDTKRKTVQHASGGIIEKVLVREAQAVAAGEPLLVLNQTTARAAHEQTRQRYLSLRATQSRLQAEQTDAGRVSFHADVVAAQADAVIREHARTEEQLFASRRAALKAELAAMDASMRAQEELAAGLAAQLVSRREQLALLREERDGLRGMVADGYAPKNKLLEIERAIADVSATATDLSTSRTRALNLKAELALRRVQRVQDYRKEVTAQLAEVQREVVADAEKLKAAREELERTTIRSPAKGVVVGIATQTVGGVVPPGGKLMDIVPDDEVAVLEAHIPPQLIDRVHAGQLADVRFAGFPQTPQLVVEGKLLSVSADVLNDPVTNAPYYLGRVVLTTAGLKRLGERRLTPGMPVEVIVKTGERTLIEYWLGPMLRRLSRGGREA